MTYYETPAGARVFAAGTLDFGGSRHFWPMTRMLENLWQHMLQDLPAPAPCRVPRGRVKAAALTRARRRPPGRSTPSSSMPEPGSRRSLTMSQWIARLVRAAEIGVAVAEREVDGAVHLLVEQRVLHVARDPRVAADPELAEPARALVGVERLDQELLVRVRPGVDDPPAREAEPDARDLAARVDGGELARTRSRPPPSPRRAAEELAAGHVRAERVDAASSRPASDSRRSVPAPTIRTSSAASKRVGDAAASARPRPPVEQQAP